MAALLCVSPLRRMMIERIAAHLADFSPRLQSHTRSLYQYLPIPLIGYPQLDSELFCNIYYLKHLCDATRFPDWPIRDPVRAVCVCVCVCVCVQILGPLYIQYAQSVLAFVCYTVCEAYATCAKCCVRVCYICRICAVCTVCVRCCAAPCR